MNTHEKWMRYALNLAQEGQEAGEVPIAAVIVKNDQLIAEAYNAPISENDPTAHAEILALRRAAEKLQNYRLTACDLYVTLEPCVMCAGAIVHARIANVIYAATDPRAGAVESLFQLFDSKSLNHSVNYVGGVLAEEAGALLRDFFRVRR